MNHKLNKAIKAGMKDAKRRHKKANCSSWLYLINVPELWLYCCHMLEEPNAISLWGRISNWVQTDEAGMCRFHAPLLESHTGLFKRMHYESQIKQADP